MFEKSWQIKIHGKRPTERGRRSRARNAVEDLNGGTKARTEPLGVGRFNRSRYLQARSARGLELHLAKPDTEYNGQFWVRTSLTCSFFRALAVSSGLRRFPYLYANRRTLLPFVRIQGLLRQIMKPASFIRNPRSIQLQL